MEGGNTLDAMKANDTAASHADIGALKTLNAAMRTLNAATGTLNQGSQWDNAMYRSALQHQRNSEV